MLSLHNAHILIQNNYVKFKFNSFLKQEEDKTKLLSDKNQKFFLFV